MAIFQCPNCKTLVHANASRNCSHCGNQNEGHKLVLVQGQDAAEEDKRVMQTLTQLKRTRRASW